MAGITDLAELIRNMRPTRNDGTYVFCTIDPVNVPPGLDPVGSFREAEGLTLILPKEQADAAGLEYSFEGAWITLKVHSDLEAVGLTASISQALAQEGISCNVVAAFYHDHVFVSLKDADRALAVLQQLSQSGT